MTEAEQLAILKCAPGFILPSAEWLAGLAVGDSIMVTHYANGRLDTKCLVMIDELCAEYIHFTIGHLGSIRINRSSGVDASDAYWIWIGPIEQPVAKPQTAGLFGKYVLTKADGEPLDPAAKYFVLRYDAGSKDRVAAQLALLKYAAVVGLDGGTLADDIRKSIEVES